MQKVAFPDRSWASFVGLWKRVDRTLRLSSPGPEKYKIGHLQDHRALSTCKFGGVCAQISATKHSCKMITPHSPHHTTKSHSNDSAAKHVMFKLFTCHGPKAGEILASDHVQHFFGALFRLYEWSFNVAPICHGYTSAYAVQRCKTGVCYVSALFLVESKPSL